jgi:DNA-binding CsgD family transcriptional regulator
MRQKSYDDDRLIELLSEPDLTHGDIADRLGLSRRMLGYIVRGVYRKDLRPRIREASRERLRRRRGGTTWEAVPRGEAYDDDEMVAMLAQGEKTTGEIARHFGISRDMVWRISTGRRRPDLHQRVNRIVEEARAMVHRQAVASLEALLRRHIEVGLTGTGETARKCREFVLGLFLNPTSLAQTLSTPSAPSAIQRDLAALAAGRDIGDAVPWSLSDVARRAKSDAPGSARGYAAASTAEPEAEGGDAALDRKRIGAST